MALFPRVGSLLSWCQHLAPEQGPWPSIFLNIRVFSSELTLHIRWPKYWRFSFSISSSNEYSGLISFRIDWFDLLAVMCVCVCVCVCVYLYLVNWITPPYFNVFKTKFPPKSPPLISRLWISFSLHLPQCCQSNHSKMQILLHITSLLKAPSGSP